MLIFTFEIMEILSMIQITISRKTAGTIFTTFHFLHNLQMGPIGQSATWHSAGKLASSKDFNILGPFVNYEVLKNCKKRLVNTNKTNLILKNTYNFPMEQHNIKM